MSLVARSCIKPSLLRAILYRGTILALAGALIIVGSGTLLPYFLLHVLGLPFLLLGFILIGVGLLPYRRLTKLELSPYEIAYDNDFFILRRQEKALFKWPVGNIERVDYIEKERLYGLGIQLKGPLKGRAIVYGERVDLSPFISPLPGYDLFLPYFTKSAHEEFEDYL